MNHLFYVEHAKHLSKMGFHTKGIYTAEEVARLEASGSHIFRKKKVVAKCKGQEVEVKRKTSYSFERPGVYGMGVECVE